MNKFKKKYFSRSVIPACFKRESRKFYSDLAKTKKLIIGLIILGLLSPLGILIPYFFNTGDAWGEWGEEALEKMLGFIPDGMKKLSSLWKAPLADYSFFGESTSIINQVISYIFSAYLGFILIWFSVKLLSKFIVKNDKQSS